MPQVTVKVLVGVNAKGETFCMGGRRTTDNEKIGEAIHRYPNHELYWLKGSFDIPVPDVVFGDVSKIDKPEPKKAKTNAERSKEWRAKRKAERDLPTKLKQTRIHPDFFK